MNATSAEKTRRDDDDRSAIVVAGREVRLGRGVRVVRWHDADGMSAYATSPPLGPTAPGHAPEVAAAMRPTDVAPAPRHGVRRRVHALSDDLGAIVGEDVSDATMTTEEEIRDAIDKVVIHYDACGSSAKCFDVLHNQRGLSCHFLIDVDGTIYQTLDARERAWHATTANDSSVGVELAHRGAVEMPKASAEDGTSTDATNSEHPHRIVGFVHWRELSQAPFADAQYASLAALVAGVMRACPRVRCEYPRGTDGEAATTKLEDDALRAFRGVLGHFHVQTNKIDPGPAFDWEGVAARVRKMREEEGEDDR